jgi:uncharacterized protein (DUF58 family)
MATTNHHSADAAGAMTALAPTASAVDPARRVVPSRPKTPERVAFRPSGTRLSPAAGLPWLLGVFAVASCIAPWITRGWKWFDPLAVAVAFMALYEALALWFGRTEFTPVFLSPEKGLRGREGESISVPIAIEGRSRRRRSELRIAIMPATRKAETAIRVEHEPQQLRLDRPLPEHPEPVSTNNARIHLWPWTPEITLLRRGTWPGPRVGIERRSPLGIWRLRRWFDLPSAIRIDADLRSGRREILRSPVYRSLVASRETPWTGHGRDFERLREYQPGDNYAEIAWKSTARRGAPVTRLFQWEQKQEVYFLVDQSRLSALPLDEGRQRATDVRDSRAPRRFLDLAVETALVGATVALELGDEFGLITFADEPKSWLRAGTGQFQFHQFRDQLLNLEPLPTTADYDVLFANIRVRLRRRAYLVLLADLAERATSDSMCRGIGLTRSSHVVLMTSVLPVHARSAFSPGEEPRTDQDVYAALAAEKENQRLWALARRIRQSGAKLRFVPPANFLRSAVEGYLESKREQRV